MMRLLLFPFLVLLSFSGFSQNMIAFQDYRDRFYIFDEGRIFLESSIKVHEYGYANNSIAYFNNQRDFMLYRNGETTKITFNANSFHTSDYLIAYQGGTGLKAIDDGKIIDLTLNLGYYQVTDSLAIYEDNLKNTFNVYYKGQIKEVARGVFNDPASRVEAGENIFAFHNSQGQKYQVFWNNQIQDVLTSNEKIKFHCGRNIMAFNDIITQSFVIFYKGEFFDAESLHAKKYLAGDDLVAYEDMQGNLKVFDPLNIFEIQTISSYSPDYFEVRDRIVVFTENNNLFKVYDGNEVRTLEANFMPPSYQMDDNMIVWMDQMGGLKALIDGEVVQVISEKIKDFEVHGKCIKIKLQNDTYNVYWKGKLYSFL